MINSQNKSFTLLEMLICVAVIVIGTLGVFSSVAKYSQFTQRERDTVIAAYLCQEGIEIVKNLRDSNWINSATWNNGLTSCSAGCQADYTFSYSSLPLATAYSSTGYLYIDSSTGLYGYTSGTKTNYTRKITINYSVTDKLAVQVDVYWPSHTMTVREDLYNWR
jgi:type II secretory pathway pseudopilin PulG